MKLSLLCDWIIRGCSKNLPVAKPRNGRWNQPEHIIIAPEGGRELQRVSDANDVCVQSSSTEGNAADGTRETGKASFAGQFARGYMEDRRFNQDRPSRCELDSAGRRSAGRNDQTGH